MSKSPLVLTLMNDHGTVIGKWSTSVPIDREEIFLPLINNLRFISQSEFTIQELNEELDKYDILAY